MPFRWASSSKSCLQYKVRAHRFWLSRKADRDIIDIVFCDRFIFPKSPLMRRYFHERNKNISYMNFAFLICDVSIKTWINKEKHDFFTALLAQLTAHVNLPDSFIAPAHIGSYSQTSSYEETVIACGIGIYQCNDCATGAAHTVCVWWKFVCFMWARAKTLLIAGTWLAYWFIRQAVEQAGKYWLGSDKIALFFCFCFHCCFVLYVEVLQLFVGPSKVTYVSHCHINCNGCSSNAEGDYWPMAMVSYNAPLSDATRC